MKKMCSIFLVLIAGFLLLISCSSKTPFEPPDMYYDEQYDTVVYFLKDDFCEICDPSMECWRILIYEIDHDWRRIVISLKIDGVAIYGVGTLSDLSDTSHHNFVQGRYYDFEIETTLSTIKTRYGIPYLITDATFPEDDYDYTKPFTLNWTMPGNNQYQWVTRKIEHQCDNDYGLWSGCCEYDLVELIRPSSRKYYFSPLALSNVCNPHIDLAIESSNYIISERTIFYTFTQWYLCSGFKNQSMTILKKEPYFDLKRTINMIKMLEKDRQ